MDFTTTASLYAIIIYDMKKLILNRVAIWQAKTLDDFAMRPSPAGRVYFENNIAKTSTRPMFRYAKNYYLNKGKKSELRFCLFIMTFSEAEKRIEQFLDEVAKTVDAGYVQKVLLVSSASNFEYTDSYYREGE